MVAHMDGVQHGILERNATEFAIVCFGGRVGTIWIGSIVVCIGAGDRFDRCGGVGVLLMLLIMIVLVDVGLIAG